MFVDQIIDHRKGKRGTHLMSRTSKINVLTVNQKENPMMIRFETIEWFDGVT